MYGKQIKVLGKSRRNETNGTGWLGPIVVRGYCAASRLRREGSPLRESKIWTRVRSKSRNTQETDCTVKDSGVVSRKTTGGTAPTGGVRVLGL